MISHLAQRLFWTGFPDFSPSALDTSPKTALVAPTLQKVVAGFGMSREEDEIPDKEKIRLRIYYEFERPRNGFIQCIPVRSPVKGSDIWKHLASNFDRDRYTPHAYDGDLECFVGIGESADHTFHAANGPPLHLPRLDVKLVQAAPPVRADALICDSSGTSLTGSWFGIGIVRGKTASNHGSLWRSALQFGAALTFTIGQRYEKKVEGSADIYKTYRQIPCMGYQNTASFMTNAPIDTQIVVIEYGGEDLATFSHPKRALYVLGSEDCGVPPALVSRAHKHVAIPTAEGRPASLNVAAAGAIVLYDRHVKMLAKQRETKASDS